MASSAPLSFSHRGGGGSRAGGAGCVMCNPAASSQGRTRGGEREVEEESSSAKGAAQRGDARAAPQAPRRQKGAVSLRQCVWRSGMLCNIPGKKDARHDDAAARRRRSAWQAWRAKRGRAQSGEQGMLAAAWRARSPHTRARTCRMPRSGSSQSAQRAGRNLASRPSAPTPVAHPDAAHGERRPLVLIVVLLSLSLPA